MTLLKILIFAFLFTAFFPYITFLPIELGSDLQPYALIISAILFILIPKHLPKEMMILLLITFEATVIFLTSDIGFNEFRSLSSYVSLFLISFVTYTVLKQYEFNVKKIVQFMIILYFIIGITQLLIDKSFLTFLAHDWRTTDGRGVTNLMVEPTYYAIFCLLSIFIAYELQLKTKYIVLLVFQIIVFAKSAMVIVLLSLFLGLKFFFLRYKAKEILITFTFFLFLSIGFLLYESELANMRVIEIVLQAINDPFELIKLDKSINERLLHLFFSLHGWISNFFIFPNGFSIFGYYLTENLPDYAEYFTVKNYGDGGARIMSGYGAALFELGIGGVLLISYVWYLQTSLTYPIYIKIFFLLFMLTGVPLAIPLVGLYIGLLQYNSIFKEKR